MGGIGGMENVSALTVYNGELYAGGNFLLAGTNTANCIAKWDGTAWSAVGGGMSTNGVTSVTTLSVYNGELFAGGLFTTADGNPVNHIAKWNGTNWLDVGGGLNDIVRSLHTFNGELYAGGRFTVAGGNPANYIAKWDGVNWSDVGGGMDSTVSALGVYDSVLYAGGLFTHSGGIPANHIARWNPLSIGMWENVRNDEAKVYPNPFSNYSTIVLNKEVKNAVLSIYNIVGKKVRTKAFNGSQQLIEKGDLEEGVYFYQITSVQEVIASGKLIIQ